MKILMLNGPPESGKDVIADLIVQKINDSGIKSEKKMVKSLLIKTAIKMSGVTVDEWDRHYERDLKEVPWYKLVVGGNFLSPREYLIHISENVMKVIYGETIFGMGAAEDVSSSPDTDVFVFSDSGFKEELIPLQGLTNDLYIARIYREGKTFAGDSRNYLYPTSIPIDKQKDFINNRTIDEISEEIIGWLMG